MKRFTGKRNKGISSKALLNVYDKGKALIKRDKYLCGTPYAYHMKATALEIMEANRCHMMVYPHRIHPFTYNGFYGKSEDDKFTDYRASFIRWSGDPGIALMKCSDGIERLIPTYALTISFILPMERTKNPVLFGSASKS